jgi:hypothetical protein
MQTIETFPAVALLARQNLERAVQNGRTSAARVLGDIMTRVPDDSLVRGDALDFNVTPSSVNMSAAGSEWSLHKNALDQLSTRLGIPSTYVKSLQTTGDDSEWRARLLEQNLRELAHRQAERHLVRSVHGQARAVVSDRFRRLDSRPMLDAFLGACNVVGAVPYEGIASDLSASVRAIVPTVFEPVGGECIVFGLSWSNSDYGTRAYSISAFMLRLVCLNGMVGTNQLRQVHLGGRLPENVELSAQTYELDTQTMVSATRDVVRGALGAKAIEERLSIIRTAHESDVDWSSAWRRVSRELTKDEQKAAKAAFDGPEVLQLPTGKTPWRFANVLSWLANSAPDPERKLDLQRLAGAVLSEAA